MPSRMDKEQRRQAVQGQAGLLADAHGQGFLLGLHSCQQQPWQCLEQL